MKIKSLAMAAAVAGGLIAGSAAPVNAQLAGTQSALLAKAPDSAIDFVQWRRRGPSGAAVGAAIVGGILLGGAIAASRPYYYDPYYGPAPVYVAPPPGYYAVPDDAVAYCMRRYRSYDPVSGTYMGYDGIRRSCP